MFSLQAILNCYKMGLTQNRIENSLSSEKKQKETIPISGDKSQNEGQSEEGQIIDERGFQIAPISIPQFFIKFSPFKLFARLHSEEVQKPTLSPNPKQEPECSSDKPNSLNESDKLHPSENRSWLEVVYHSVLFGKILSYLNSENDLNLMLVNHRIYSEIFLQRLLVRDNNWLSPLTHIKSKPDFEDMYWKLSAYEEESEHSLDLDRTESFFHTDLSEIVDKTCQVAKLDRIMKALTASGIPYSQGVNSIVAKLISFFQEETAYWVIIFLMKKTRNIHNNCQVYQSFMADIEVLIQQKLPQIFKKLDDLEFNVEYFAMKWVMSLFSYDFNGEILFYLWDIFLIYDAIDAMKMFILSLFEELEPKILQENYDRDQINALLKHNLRQTINTEMGKRIINKTKIHIVNKKYGEDFLPFYHLANIPTNTLTLGFQLQSARKNSRNFDQNSFMHLLESPKQQNFQQQIEEEPQELEESQSCLQTSIGLADYSGFENLHCTNTIQRKEIQQEQQIEDNKIGEVDGSSSEEEGRMDEKLLHLQSESGNAKEKTVLTFE